MTRILIATQVRLYREGLARVFSNTPGCVVVGAVADVAEVVPLVHALTPDVVLVEAGAGSLGDLLSHLGAGSRPVPVVLLGVSEDPDHIVALAEAGISGYVTREDSIDRTIDTLVSVARGEMPCSPLVASGLMRRLASVASTRAPVDAIDRLTAREREILQLLERGESNKEIAARLHIEPTTVKNHVSSILEKLGVRRRAQAAALLRRAADRAGAVS